MKIRHGGGNTVCFEIGNLYGTALRHSYVVAGRALRLCFGVSTSFEIYTMLKAYCKTLSKSSQMTRSLLLSHHAVDSKCIW